MALPSPTSPPGREVVRWYTSALRFPRLVGKWPSGRPIPFGPYTLVQVAGGIGVLLLAARTSGLWATASISMNAAIVAILTGLTVFGLGQVPIGSRNLLVLAAGVAGFATRALTGPDWDTGAAVTRLRAPHPDPVLLQDDLVPEHPNQAPTGTGAPADPDTTTAPSTEPPAPSPVPPAPVPEPAGAVPALSAVQRALALAAAGKDLP